MPIFLGFWQNEWLRAEGWAKLNYVRGNRQEAVLRWNIHFSVPSVQVDNNVDESDQDLGRDEYDDC